MSADGDTVREALDWATPHVRSDALAALARLEAAAAQRDALAEAQAKALTAIDAEIATLRGWYEDCREEGSDSEASAYWHKIDGLKFARAALAEAGL